MCSKERTVFADQKYYGVGDVMLCNWQNVDCTGGVIEHEEPRVREEVVLLSVDTGKPPVAL